MNSSLDQSSASIQKGSKSFSLAALFLPKAARPQVYALYSWCRACDDAVDAGDNHPNLKALKAYAMDDPLIRSLIANQLCSEKYFDEMLCGMQMDLDHRGYQTLDELEVYGFRVAGVVGLMMCPLIGVQDPKALDHGIALGIAMQLTNICRDVFEDANRGRVYLPLSELGYKDHGTAVQILTRNPEHAHLVVKKVLARADELYLHGRRGFHYIPLRTCFSIALAARIYQLIGYRLLKAATKDPLVAFRNRTVVPWHQKLLASVEALFWTLKSRRRQRRSLPAIFPKWSDPKMEA